MRTALTCLFSLCGAMQGFAAFNLTWAVPAVALDSNPPFGDTDNNAKIAVDPFGNAVATWSRTTGAGHAEDIWASIYNHAARVWTGAIQVSNGASASHGAVAIDSSGCATLLWDEGFPTQIMSRTIDRNGVWGPAIEIAPSTHAQIMPQVKVDKEGNALAIWMEYAEGTYRIHSAQKPYNGTWKNLGRISSESKEAAIQLNSPLSLNPEGKGAAVWEEKNRETQALEVYAAYYEAGAWSPPTLIATPATSPSVGIDGSGNGVIVWDQNSSIQSKKFHAAVFAETILPVSNPAFGAQRPFVAVDLSGNAVVVYERFDTAPGDSPTIRFITGAHLLSESTQWSRPTELSTPNPHTALKSCYPVLSLNAIGDGVAIWKEYDGEKSHVQGVGFSLGTWGLHRLLSSSEGNVGSESYDLDVSLNLAGNILAIWPEDPNGFYTQQMKAAAGVGLAVNGLEPPIATPSVGLNLARKETHQTIDPATRLSGIATGYQVLRRFPAHGDLINFLSWSPSERAVQYKIYRGHFASLVTSTSETRFEDHQRTPGQKETYLITAVDDFGQESPPLTIVVHPL